MIPKEKIEKAALDYAEMKNGDIKMSQYIGFKSGVSFAEVELSRPPISPNVKQNLFVYFAEQHDIQLVDSDFYEIQKYMQPELQSIAQEFAEWVELKCVALCGNLWEFINDPYSEAHTSSELFDEFMAYRNETINCITFNKAAQNDIPADIRKQMDTDRAEAERQSIAIEFAEWCTINAKPVTNGKALRYWRLYTYQSSISYSTQHLFAKFMAERTQQ